MAKISVDLRTKIYERDNYKCYVCGVSVQNKPGTDTLDHYIPKRLGGSYTFENLRTCCRKCNSDKGDQVPQDLSQYGHCHPVSLVTREITGSVQHHNKLQKMKRTETKRAAHKNADVRRIKQSESKRAALIRHEAKCERIALAWNAKQKRKPVPIKTCILDLDGVFADFFHHWHALRQLTPPAEWPAEVWDLTHVYTELSDDQVYDGMTAEWWANMPWTKDGKAILEVVAAHFRAEDVCICTSNGVMDEAASAAGKVAWIHREMPQYKDRYFIGRQKHFMARPDALLIDDNHHNVDAFTAAGGHAFLLPRRWNRHYHNQDPAAALRDYLATAEITTRPA